MSGKQMHYSDYRLLKLRIIYLLYNIGVLKTQRFGAFVLEQLLAIHRSSPLGEIRRLCRKLAKNIRYW